MATGTVTANSLNFRSTPDGDVKKQLLKGSTVEILEDQGEGLKVESDGEEGCVNAKFIQRAGDTPVPPPGSGTGKFRFDGTAAVAPDGTRFAKKFKLGVFDYGATSITQFVSDNSARFAAVSPSRLRVMQAVSENEGKLEAINTWDNAFLTFGIFQWTVGSADGAGELPSLLDRLKQTSPSVFDTFFGQNGL